MTDAHTWPESKDEVHAAPLQQLLKWNQHLPAPDEGTEKYDLLALIVERLRLTRAQYAPGGPHEDEKLPQADHPGWPIS